MNNLILSNQPLSDVCISYALAYSEYELSNAFSRIVERIIQRHSEQKTDPITISHGPFETEHLPTSIEDGLWHFFANVPSGVSGPSPTCIEAYKATKDHMITCFLPFRKFTEQDWQDAMKLKILQNSMNIIARGKAKGATLSYSKFSRLVYTFRSLPPPPLE